LKLKLLIREIVGLAQRVGLDQDFAAHFQRLEFLEGLLEVPAAAADAVILQDYTVEAFRELLAILLPGSRCRAFRRRDAAPLDAA
jgi:hypothetical protein